MTAWFPFEYVDEGMPPDRSSPSAWLAHLADGAPALAAAEDGGAPRALKNHEIVPFMSRDDVAEARLTLRADKSWAIDRTMPAEADTCCILEGWQVDTVSGTLEDTVAALIDADADPGEYVVAYAAWSEPLPFRYDATAHAFIPVYRAAA